MTTESLITGLSRANLPVVDLDRATEFYERLELEVAYRTERAAFVWLEPGRSQLALWKRGPAAADVALEVARSDVDEAVEWLRSRGVEPTSVGDTVAGWTHQGHALDAVAFDDPFGNTIALIDPGSLDSEPTTDTERPTAENAFITGLNEAHLLVDDVEETVAFYEGVLGLPVAWRDDETAFVWTEAGRAWLGLWEGWMPEDHVAFEVTLDDLARCESWLSDRGVELREDSGFTVPYVRPHQPIASAYFHDTEGNDLELLCPLSTEPTDDSEKIALEEWLATRA